MQFMKKAVLIVISTCLLEPVFLVRSKNPCQKIRLQRKPPAEP